MSDYMLLIDFGTGYFFRLPKNREDRKRGHFFYAEFKSVIIEDELYGSEVSCDTEINQVFKKKLLNSSNMYPVSLLKQDKH